MDSDATRRQEDLPGGSDPHVVKTPCRKLCDMDTHTHTHLQAHTWAPMMIIHAFHIPVLSYPVLSPCTHPMSSAMAWTPGRSAAPRCKGRCTSQLPCCPSRFPCMVILDDQVSGEPLLRCGRFLWAVKTDLSGGDASIWGNFGAYVRSQLSADSFRG